MAGAAISSGFTNRPIFISPCMLAFTSTLYEGVDRDAFTVKALGTGQTNTSGAAGNQRKNGYYTLSHNG